MPSFMDRDVTFHLAIFVLIAISPMDFWILVVSYLPSVDKDRLPFGGLDLFSLDFGHGHALLGRRMTTRPWIDEC